MRETPDPLPLSRTLARDLLLLALLLAAVLGPQLGRRALWEPDEGRYAEIPREMVASGDWVTPRVDGVKYFEKPPLVYWATAASITLFGHGEAAARLPIALSALGGIFAVYLAGRRLFGRVAGLWSGAVLATTPLWLGLGQILSLDMPVSALLTVALLAFLLALREPPGWSRRLHLWAFYGAAALATLSKGLIGIVIPALVIGAFILLTRSWRLIPVALAPTGIALFLAIAAPWHLLAARAHPEFAWFYFVHEHFLRYVTTTHNRYEPPWFFLPVLVGGLVPWTALLPQALLDAWRAGSNERRDALFLGLWAALVVAFFSLSDSKLIPYVLPAVPPLALLTGRWIARAVSAEDDNEDARSPLRRPLVALAAIGLVAAVAIAFWPAPAPGSRDAETIALLGGARFALAGCLAALGVGPLLFDRLGRRKAAAALLVAGSALFLATLLGVLPRFDRGRSTRAVADVLRPELGPNDEVAIYHHLLHTLPYYLARRVTIVGYTGELDFGTRQEPAVRDWMIDEAEFQRRWHGERRMFVVVETRRSKTQPPGLTGARVVADQGSFRILSNR